MVFVPYYLELVVADKIKTMSAYAHQMERQFSARSLSSRGGSGEHHLLLFHIDWYASLIVVLKTSLD